MLLRCLEPGAFVAVGERDDAPLSAADVAARFTPAHQPDVILLLPATRCLVMTVPVAKHEVKHLARTLPWTLEERLLEPVEQLHVAHGQPHGGNAPVAVINAAWLRQVLDDLQAAGVQPQWAASELLLLPWQPDQWTVFIPASHTAPVLVRHGAHAGFACARGNLQTALQLLLNELSDAPRQVVVLTDAATEVDDAALFPGLLQSRLAPQRRVAAQLPDAAAVSACNLLQGRFAPALPWALWWRQWRVAAALLAALLISDVALTAYDSLRLERAAAAHEAAVVDLYRSVQPDGVVVDARLQLEQALAAVGAADHESFLSLLSRMAPALQAVPGARVQNIEYDSNSGYLQLQVLTSDIAAESLRAQLQQVGLQAELLGSSNDSAGNRTRLRIGGGV